MNPEEARAPIESHDVSRDRSDHAPRWFGFPGQLTNESLARRPDQHRVSEGDDPRQSGNHCQ